MHRTNMYNRLTILYKYTTIDQNQMEKYITLKKRRRIPKNLFKVYVQNMNKSKT